MIPPEKEIKTKLMLLPENGRILFCGFICEKLYPHYIVFEKKHQWGDSESLAEGISLIFEYLIDKNAISIQNIENAIVKIDMATPDTEDFGDLLCSFALNAATAISGTLEYLLNKNINDIMYVVSYAFDTIDFFLQEKERINTSDPSREIQIENNAFTITEKERQTTLIDLISKIDNLVITDSLLDQLRTGGPIIDLSLLSL